eukprot:1122136-Pleurochrysis_carterae.AAC.2
MSYCFNRLLGLFDFSGGSVEEQCRLFYQKGVRNHIWVLNACYGVSAATLRITNMGERHRFITGGYGER